MTTPRNWGHAPDFAISLNLCAPCTRPGCVAGTQGSVSFGWFTVPPSVCAKSMPITELELALELAEQCNNAPDSPAFNE